MKKNINEQNDHNILFLGHGYVAQYFCKSCRLDNFKVGVSINKSKDKYFKNSEEVKSINFLEIDGVILDNYDNFIISIPPFYELRTDIIINKFYEYFLSRKTPYKLIYLSATSVYGDHNGKRVKENSELKAKSVNGLARIECESAYLKLQKNKWANIVILRLSAIYGDKRNRISLIQKKNIIESKFSSRLISRIHIVDIISIIRAIILSTNVKNEIFNIADNNPCPTSEINDYICKELLKIDSLPISKDVSEYRHDSFALDNKIVDNDKIKKQLHYELSFPLKKV